MSSIVERHRDHGPASTQQSRELMRNTFVCRCLPLPENFCVCKGYVLKTIIVQNYGEVNRQRKLRYVSVRSSTFTLQPHPHRGWNRRKQLRESCMLCKEFATIGHELCLLAPKRQGSSIRQAQPLRLQNYFCAAQYRHNVYFSAEMLFTSAFTCGCCSSVRCHSLARTLCHP